MPEPKAAPVPDPITYADFEKIDMRIGRIVRAEQFPEARRPAYRLWIDFGDIGVKRSSAQVTGLYETGSLVGRQVVAVVNFPPKQVAGFMSEVLLLGVPSADGEIVLLAPDREVPDGGRVY